MKCPKCRHENPENLEKAEKLFREIGMDYWLTKTKGVLEKFHTS